MAGGSDVQLDDSQTEILAQVSMQPTNLGRLENNASPCRAIPDFSSSTSWKEGAPEYEGQIEIKSEEEYVETIHGLDDGPVCMPTPASFAALTNLYYSSSSKAASDSDGSFRLSSMNSKGEIIVHTEDWGATYSSGALTGDDNNVTKDGKDGSIKHTNPERPEKILVDFGLRLVILDKTLSGVGILAFIWATVVLLGGFASTLKTIDFWFVAGIILIVGTGIFSRNHHLESRFFFQAAKAISGKIGKIITAFQLIFACITCVLSLMRLVEQAYSKYEGQTNMKAALNIFYVAALAHALLFLLGKAYWFWTVSYLNIIEIARMNYGFRTSGVVVLRRFFYEAYWKLSQGSIFHALEIDLITFAQELLFSNYVGDQLIAVRTLNSMITHPMFLQETHLRIRTSTETISRLVKMLFWYNKEEQAIQKFAANIVIELVKDFQVEGIQETVEFICSLLQQEDGSERKSVEQNLLGLKILKSLARNPMICLKITQKIDLLSRTVDIIAFEGQLDLKRRIAESSLKLLKRIVSKNGEVGHIIRQNISRNGTVGSNLRIILIYGSDKPVLFQLVVEILTALSMNKAAQEKIGKTPGIIRVLVSAFLNASDRRFWPKAGEALVALTLQNKRICHEILKENANFVQQLIVLLDKEKGYQALKMLRNLCAYSGTTWHERLREVILTLPRVLKTMMSQNATEGLLEASVGLCVQISKFTSFEQFTKILKEAKFTMREVVVNLLEILSKPPNARIPCLRRHIIELVIWIMESNGQSIQYLKEHKLEEALVGAYENIAEFENFHYFSGNFGVMKHSKTFYSLVRKAKRLLGDAVCAGSSNADPNSNTTSESEMSTTSYSNEHGVQVT